MAASCYLCEQGYDTIPERSTGDAVGACKLCGVLACLGHGMRNPNRPAYVCGCCVPNLLAAAAVHRVDPARVPSDLAAWARDVVTVQDVIVDFDGDHWGGVRNRMESLLRIFARRDMADALQMFEQARPDASMSLLAAATAIAVTLNLPQDELLPVLRGVTQAVQVRA